MADTQAFFSNPVVGYALALILLVVQMRMSATNANFVLIAAWVFLLWAVFQTPPIARQPLIPRMLWVLLFGSIIGLALYHTLWSTPVTVSPNQFVLHSGQWANRTTVTVTNVGHKQLYSVFIKIWTKTPGLVSQDIKVEPTEDDSHAPPVSVGVDDHTFQVRSDVLIQDFIDSQQREAVLIRFYALVSNEPRHLQVFTERALASSVTVKVLGFKSQPDRVITRQGSAAFIFSIPETGKIKGFRFKTGEVSP